MWTEGPPSKVLKNWSSLPRRVSQYIPTILSLTVSTETCGVHPSQMDWGTGVRTLQTSLSGLGPGQGEASSSAPGLTGWAVSLQQLTVDLASGLLGAPFVHCITAAALL